MKTYLKTIIVVLTLSLLCFVGYNIYAKVQYKSEVNERLQNLPDFSFETLEKEIFTKNNLEKDKVTILVFFNSDCDYCQSEATAIQKRVLEFGNTQLIFVSDEEIKTIQKFSIAYRLNTYDNITFLSDPKDNFTNKFDGTLVPYILIYDKNQQLIKKQKGQLKVENLILLVK